MSGYWRMSLRTNAGGSLYLFSTSSERTALAVLYTLTEETGCDRFYVELEGSDADVPADFPIGGATDVRD